MLWKVNISRGACLTENGMLYCWENIIKAPGSYSVTGRVINACTAILMVSIKSCIIFSLFHHLFIFYSSFCPIFHFLSSFQIVISFSNSLIHMWRLAMFLFLHHFFIFLSFSSFSSCSSFYHIFAMF